MFSQKEYFTRNILLRFGKLKKFILHTEQELKKKHSGGKGVYIEVFIF